ncbi:hypothetical protein [Antribacter gilvus]|uniref:hypothetical protein n=1 Tax=Antribacter gilvus TaxID=2304675 RepID=UPI000F79BBC9|nr:hypothetical protein [Antribacter gilvus]
MTRGAVGALVESPLQLICTIEAHAAGLGGTPTRVHVRSDVPSLEQVRDTVAASVLPDGVTLDVRGPGAALTSFEPGRIVGEAFSGLFQLALLTRPVRSIVLVDDGLAALDLARILASSDAALIRPGLRLGAGRRILGRLAAARLRGLAHRGRLTVFTALPVASDIAERLVAVGVNVVRNDFTWLSTQPMDETPPEPTVVLGSELVATGLVDEDDYLGWVLSMAAEGPLLYLPFRRENPAVARVLARTPGVTVADAGAALELRLSGMKPGQRVRSLPSTTAVVLTTILGHRGVDVETVPVPDAWWTPRSTPEQHAFAARLVPLAEAARSRG